MTNKFISVVTLFCMLVVLLIANVSPADPLFSIISPDPAISALRLSLVAVMIYVAFKTFIKNRFLRRGLTGAGLVLIVFGLVSLVNPYISGLFYHYLMPLDLLLIVEAGIVLTAASFDRQIEPEYQRTEDKIPVRFA